MAVRSGRYDLKIRLEDWQDSFTFIDRTSGIDVPVDIDDARAQIYNDNDVLIFDLTVANSRVVITDNLVELSISYTDLKTYYDSVSNVNVSGYWDMLVQRNIDSKLKAYLWGSVNIFKAATQSIS